MTTPSDAEIAARSLDHLQQVVAIDSASDESSSTIPSTPGQATLADRLRGFFEGFGAEVEQDDYANLIASFPGRGAGQGAAPIALMIHLDTARGTHAVDALNVAEKWQGDRVPYPANDALQVTVENYPSLERYLGQDVVYGPGDAPFGLDDKLGLAHLMTLVWLLGQDESVDHPPLLIVARPDEEIGRMEALLGLADGLAERGVRSGYTIDGLDPFEINVENFNASRGSVWFEPTPVDVSGRRLLRVSIGGVNTHGATAKAEGHRPATRLAAEIVALLEADGLVPDAVMPVDYASDDERDCDGVMVVAVVDDAAERAVRERVEEVVAPHVARGASWAVEALGASADELERCDGAALEALRFVAEFFASEPGFTLYAEESEGHEGYSQPYRIVADGDALRLDVRLRDFTEEGLGRRQDHLRELTGSRRGALEQQYVNMGPELEKRPELVRWAREAAEAIGVDAPVQPIRGGTGVDPFLDRGIAVANLGTGYFAPESEKELTTLQTMAGHARWLLALVSTIASD